MTRKIVAGYRKFTLEGGEIRPLRREPDRKPQTAIARFMPGEPLRVTGQDLLIEFMRAAVQTWKASL